MAVHWSDLPLVPTIPGSGEPAGRRHPPRHTPLVQADQILYRQQVLTDCLNNSEAVRSLYELTRNALSKQKSSDLRFSELQSVSSQFDRCLTRLTYLVSTLHALWNFAQDREANFGSKGFQSLFLDLSENLDDRFFAGADDLLQQLQFREGDRKSVV